MSEKVLVGATILDIEILEGEKVIIKFIKNGNEGIIELFFSEWLWVESIVFDDEEWKDQVFINELSISIATNIINSKRIQMQPRTKRKLGWPPDIDFKKQPVEQLPFGLS